MLAKVHVHATPGEATVQINDREVSDQVQSARIDLGGRGKIPVLWLETLSGDLEFEGEAEINVVALGTPAQEFLGAIDADELDRAVNAALQVEPGSYAELALRVLRDWAAGRS